MNSLKKIKIGDILELGDKTKKIYKKITKKFGC